MMLWKAADNATWAGHHKPADSPEDRGSCELRTMHVAAVAESPLQPSPAVGRTFPFSTTVYAACLGELGPLSQIIVICMFCCSCLVVC